MRGEVGYPGKTAAKGLEEQKGGEGLHPGLIRPIFKTRTFLSTTNSFSAVVRLLISSSYLPGEKGAVRAWVKGGNVSVKSYPIPPFLSPFLPF